MRSGGGKQTHSTQHITVPILTLHRPVNKPMTPDVRILSVTFTFQSFHHYSAARKCQLCLTMGHIPSHFQLYISHFSHRICPTQHSLFPSPVIQFHLKLGDVTRFGCSSQPRIFIEGLLMRYYVIASLLHEHVSAEISSRAPIAFSHFIPTTMLPG